MIKVLIVSHPDEIPALPGCDIIDDQCPQLRDDNLSAVGLRTVHGEQAAATAAHRAGYTAVVACKTVEELVAAVTKLAARLGPISLLDIVGHGRPGRQRIGKEVLFEIDDGGHLRGTEIVDRLAPSLAPGSRVRLLGCKTGFEAPGRLLLAKLGQQFGTDVIVYGTIEAVAPEHFESGEFSQVEELLFSSEAAVDHEAPLAVQRIASLQSLAQ